MTWTPEMRHDLYVRAIKTHGHIQQWRQLQEECAELIAETNRRLRGRGSMEELASEIADVQIMLEQAYLLFGDMALLTRVRDEKLQRLKERLDAEDQV